MAFSVPLDIIFKCVFSLLLKFAPTHVLSLDCILLLNVCILCHIKHHYQMYILICSWNLVFSVSLQIIFKSIFCSTCGDRHSLAPYTSFFASRLYWAVAIWHSLSLHILFFDIDYTLLLAADLEVSVSLHILFKSMLCNICRFGILGLLTYHLWI